MGAALNRGYAAAGTDTGHQAGPGAFDASWASGCMDLIEDFGHRALHLTTIHGRQILAAFYPSQPSCSYYVGCSKGGQQGLMAAQRYPEDFDGVIAGDPANDWTRFYAGAHLWYSLAMTRPLCAYLQAARYDGSGSTDDAANFSCVMP